MNKKGSSKQKRIEQALNKLTSDKLVRIIMAFVILSIILGITISTFFPTTRDGFSELSLLMYDEESDGYVGEGYPTIWNTGDNRTVYVLLRNFENKVIYYQIQIKVVDYDYNISSENPISIASDHVTALFTNDSYEKILPPATNSETTSNDIFSGDYVWGPVPIYLVADSGLNTLFDYSVFEAPLHLKIVFELWSFHTAVDSFLYTGVFCFFHVNHYT